MMCHALSRFSVLCISVSWYVHFIYSALALVLRHLVILNGPYSNRYILFLFNFIWVTIYKFFLTKSPILFHPQTIKLRQILFNTVSKILKLHIMPSNQNNKHSKLH